MFRVDKGQGFSINVGGSSGRNGVHVMEGNVEMLRYRPHTKNDEMRSSGLQFAVQAAKHADLQVAVSFLRFVSFGRK